MHTNIHTSIDLRPVSEEVVRVPMRQLQVWGGEMRGIRVIELKRDEEAWEGTELDVRRTVL